MCPGKNAILLKRNPKGFVFIFVLFILVFLSGFALALSSIIRQENLVTQNHMNSMETLYHAEAGVALAWPGSRPTAVSREVSGVRRMSAT